MSDEFEYDYDVTEETEDTEEGEDEGVQIADKILAQNEEQDEKLLKKVIALDIAEKLLKQIEPNAGELTPEQMTKITQKKLAAALKEFDAEWANLPQANRDQVNSITGLRSNVAEYTARLADPKVPQEDRVTAKAKLVDAQAELNRQWKALTPKERIIVNSMAAMQANIREYSNRLAQRKR